MMNYPAFASSTGRPFTVGHTMSLSVSPQPGHPNHEAFQSALRQYFDTYARDDVFSMPTICWITAARFFRQESSV
jgi:hypothetical protein